MKRFFILMIPIGKIKHKLMEKYLPDEKSVVMKPETKCLVVGPHPDDETIGCGGIMLKYPKNFDCIVMAASGMKYKNIDAEKRADIRIKEFNSVMAKIGIKNHWIFKTFGVPPMCKQIKRLLSEYLSVLNTEQYDYIFLPHPNDNHKEHRYITNTIMKKILRQNGYKKTLKICYYGVWTPLMGATHFEDIESVQDKKYKLLDMYKSQNVVVYYPDMAAGLNQYYGGLSHAHMKHAEAFKVVSVGQYLHGKR